MWHVLDIALIAVIVIVSIAYVVYSLSSVRIKRSLLTLLVRIFGVRVFSVLSPRIGGCDNCSSTAPNLDVLQKLRKAK